MARPKSGSEAEAGAGGGRGSRNSGSGLTPEAYPGNGGASTAQVENDLPHEHVDVACGFFTTNPDFMSVSS